MQRKNALNANVTFGTGQKLNWTGFVNNPQAFFDSGSHLAQPEAAWWEEVKSWESKSGKHGDPGRGRILNTHQPG